MDGREWLSRPVPTPGANNAIVRNGMEGNVASYDGHVGGRSYWLLPAMVKVVRKQRQLLQVPSMYGKKGEAAVRN